MAKKVSVVSVEPIFSVADVPRAGSGLGLAIAQGLVEAQGGHLWAENRAGGGARVAFTLQVAPTHPLAEVAVA